MQMDALDGEHIWTAPLIDMRFNYRPQNPLYLLLVRAFRSLLLPLKAVLLNLVSLAATLGASRHAAGPAGSDVVPDIAIVPMN